MSISIQRPADTFLCWFKRKMLNNSKSVHNFFLWKGFFFSFWNIIIFFLLSRSECYVAIISTFSVAIISTRKPFRKDRFIEHYMRRQKSERLIVSGKLERKRRRGKPSGKKKKKVTRCTDSVLRLREGNQTNWNTKESAEYRSMIFSAYRHMYNVYKKADFMRVKTS